jgi:arylsulfatase A-like enzyme
MKSISLLTVLLVTSLAELHAADAPAKRPNILWLVSEDNNLFLGCYGDPLAQTPTLDRLAKEGVLYERCFAQPVCAPSRFTLITGLNAATAGPAEHMRAQGKIPAWLKGFPALLREAGYYTANNAKTDFNSPISIKEAWNESSKQAHWRKRPNPAQPFFGVFNHEVTHESCLFPEQELPLKLPPTDRAKVRIPAYQPDTPEMRDDWGRYYDHMALLDAQIAAKLQDLEKAGLAEDTIIFYYSDNGGVLPRSKRFLQESGTHVPLIVYYPPKWRHLAPAAPGSRISDPVCFADFAPTVLSLAGVKVPDYMQGRAFAGPARGATNEFVFCTRDRMDERYDMMRSVMDRRWLYIHNYRPDLPYVQPLEYMFRARGYQSWARMAAEGKLTPATAQFWGSKPTEELYDMVADPDNVKNLASDPAHHETLERLRAALKRHTLEINDNGFIPEGSPLEGYAASRKSGAYPIEQVFALATMASERDVKHLPTMIKALDDDSEPMRWWAAQGCAMLGAKAAPAEAALRKHLDDPSGAVQVAAAEALAGLGKMEAALPVLERSLQNTNAPFFALQAANVLDRLGERARPALPLIKQLLTSLQKEADANSPRAYLERIMERIVAVLEGRAQPLVYPATHQESSTTINTSPHFILGCSHEKH